MQQFHDINLLDWAQRFLLVLCLGILLPFFSFQSAAASACNGVPTRPKLQAPSNGEALSARRVQLAWERVDCATSYTVVVRKSASYGSPSDAAYQLARTKYTTRRLDNNASYWWIVEACNANGCSTSRWGKFSLGD